MAKSMIGIALALVTLAIVAFVIVSFVPAIIANLIWGIALFSQRMIPMRVAYKTLIKNGESKAN